MKILGTSDRSSRRRLLVPGAITVAGLAIASAAWACTPAIRDDLTRIQSCTPPAGATKPCKPILGTPPFPEATNIKGPRSSSFIAYSRTGSTQNQLFDLVFSTSVDKSGGKACFQSTRKLAGPVIPNDEGGLPPTQGVIPADAPLGGSEICFTDTLTHATNSTSPVLFKVII